MRIRPVLLTALTAAVGALALAPTANAGTAPLRPGPYVALGDSYSAGSGVLPPDPTAAPECARTLLNYPHLVAQRLPGRTFRDATCGAATARVTTTGSSPKLTANGSHDTGVRFRCRL